jgi:hypothetical protein
MDLVLGQYACMAIIHQDTDNVRLAGILFEYRAKKPGGD